VNLRRVRSLVSVAAVTAAIFLKIFPFSGHLIGVALVLLLTRLQSPGEIKLWFRRTPISGLLFGGLIAALLMLAIDYSVLRFPGLPLIDFSTFADSKYAKASFGLLSLTGFLIACYRLWAGERRNTLVLQQRLTEEIDKRGRPEVTVELKEGSGGILHACLMNYTSTAAVNLRIDDIPCGVGILRFENIPTMISEGFSPNLQCYFVPPDGSSNKYDIVQELIFAGNPKDSEVTKHLLAIRYTDSDGVLDWVTKCDFGYDFKRKKIVLLKQRVEDGEAENAIRELQEYDLRHSNPSQQAIRWLRKGGYIETTEVTNLQSPEDEYLVTKITDKGRLLLKRKPVGGAETRLADAQLAEIEAQRKSRQTEEEHQARMRFLTAPDSGIRQFVAERRTRRHSTEAFTVDMLASGLAASKSEVEEALRILRSRGFAKETSLPGHWFIGS